MRYHPTVILSPVVDILSDFKILDLAADEDQIDCYGAPIENGAFVWQCHGSNNQVASYWGEISFRKFAIKKRNCRLLQARQGADPPSLM